MSARRPAPPILDIRHLRIERGQTVILRDLSWRVERGQHWVILGPNGSGKTSLLKALTGYLTPTAGEIAVLGRVFGESDWRELRLQIGVVTSAFATAIPPAEPALETVISGKYAQLDLWKKITRGDRRGALGILRAIGAAHLAGREWIYLSQGERQRILVGRALMARPRLLILDEPCAGLDPVAREQFLQFLGKIARRPHAPALVLVTHHAEEIMPVFSHLLALRAGAVFVAGPKERVLTAATLTAVFGAPLRLQKKSGRYAATVRALKRTVF